MAQVASDGRLRIEIHDDGLGMDPEHLAEVNARLRRSPDPGGGFTNHIGLVVVGCLARHHGIEVEFSPARSGRDGGTTATVLLPASLCSRAS
ncbi:ATP-binding protein [Streptomyces ovatisporus]|uniref:histidine kinase n=1 Tax=Streptomyces ovatisporus TaxID=1128682 RepID=A0ABV8ZZT7_9ACTN